MQNPSKKRWVGMWLVSHQRELLTTYLAVKMHAHKQQLVRYKCIKRKNSWLKKVKCKI